MNIVRLFTRDEPIAGLEINDAWLRLALLEQGKNGALNEVRLLIEEALPPMTVAGGVIVDRQKFSSALKNLVKKAPLKLHYVIVSLPADPIYSRVFSLPQTIQGSKLEQAMKLTVGFQLPVREEDVYLDWEKIKTVPDGKNEIFLAFAPRPVIDLYLKVLIDVGLNPIAIEFHPLSFLRTIDIPETDSVLLKSSGAASTAVFIVKKRELVFERVLPEKFLKKEELDNEISKIINFYEAGKEKISAILNLDECGTLKIYAAKEAGASSGKWMIGIGAAVRGLMPRSEDDLVSLMPVGTQKAYGYLKAMVFSEFLLSLTAGIAVFFLAAFIGAYLFMNNLRQKIAKESAPETSVSLPQDTVILENRALEINSFLQTAGGLIKETPQWSMIFDELKLRTAPEITVSGFDLPSADGIFTLTGHSKTREGLAVLKKSMESSTVFSQAAINISDISAKTNVAFSMQFKVKYPQLLYVYK